MEDIKSKRTKGGLYNTPLKKFTAVLDKYEVVARRGEYAKATDRDVIFDFSGVKVIETDTAFPYQVARFALKFSDADGSSWVMLEDSIADAMGITVEEARIGSLVGKTSTWEREDNHLFFTDKSGKESRGTVWRVINVEGMVGGSKSSALDTALALLEGKERTNFVGEAAAHPTIRNDRTQRDGMSLLDAILKGNFFKYPEVTALYNETNGVFVKKS